MGARELNKNHPLAFFVLIYATSIPFWFLSVHLGRSGLPDDIPLTDIGATLSPAISACYLIYREDGTAGLKRFLGRVGDYGRVRSSGWLVASIFFMPVLYVFTYVAMRLANVPVSQRLEVSSSLPGALAMFVMAATVEELGYSAYATDSLQKRFSALTTALLIGVPWALWHLPSMIKMGQAWPLIAWGLLGTVALRVITVWLYNNTNGSLFAVILAHAAATTARTVFPGGRDGYELGNGSIGYAIVILAAVLVAVATSLITKDEPRITPASLDLCPPGGQRRFDHSSSSRISLVRRNQGMKGGS
jgi:membrane protease YdiL (CAAX protease family)